MTAEPPELHMSEEDLIAALKADSAGYDPDEWLSPLDAIAHGVGRLAQNWALLEASIRRLLQRVTLMRGGMHADLILRCFDFKDQLAAIKIATVIRTIDPRLIDVVVETIDYIDNTLRPRRNRLIHDVWADERGETHAFRLNVAPKIIRPQARQPRTVHLAMEQEEVRDVWEAAFVVRDYAGFVRELADTINTRSEAKIQRLLAELPPRPLFRPPPETPGPADKATPKRKSQPRSSEG